MHKIILITFMSISFTLHAMQPAENSASQKKFENMPYIFTFTNAFSKQKQTAFNRIALLTLKQVYPQTRLEKMYNYAWSPMGYETPENEYISEKPQESRTMAISCNGSQIIMAAPCSGFWVDIFIADESSPKDLKSPKHSIPHESQPQFVTLNPDCSLLVTHTINDRLRFIDTHTGKIVRDIHFHKYINSSCFNHDGTLLALGGGCGLIDILDTQKESLGNTVIRIDNNHGSAYVHNFFSDDRVNITDVLGRKQYILPVRDAHLIAHSISLAHYNLIEAFTLAIQDGERIHANDEQWQTWLSFKKLLPDHAIKKLELFIKQDSAAGYETPDEHEESSCIIS